MILIGLGSNLSSGKYDHPRAVLVAALEKMADCGIEIKSLSPFYQAEPVPKSDQPWFVNAVAAVKTDLSPSGLLQELHQIEASLGRTRRTRWEARIIDLDILAYDDQIIPSPGVWRAQAKNTQATAMMIPHPRMHERLFVLKPLMDICPDWTHPLLGQTAADFILVAERKSQQGAIERL